VTPEETQALIAAGIREVIDNPTRYGLIWRRVPATVVDGSTATSVTVIIDGDDQELAATSLVGTLDPGQRVMIDIVPPSGMYIVGLQGAAPGYRFLTVGETQVSANLTLTTTPTALTGGSLSMTALSTVYYQATAFFDMESTVAGAAIAQGFLYVNTIQQARQALYSLNTVSRATVGQQWSGTLAAGTHTFELYAGKSAALATGRCLATHTNLMVSFYT
jgi:hypothetical protein